MRYSSQVRAARALLGWSQGKLARIAGVGLATLQRIEQSKGVVKGNFSTVIKIQKTLEKAGIFFTDDEARVIGVALQRSEDEPKLMSVDENDEGPRVHLRKRLGEKSRKGSSQK